MRISLYSSAAHRVGSSCVRRHPLVASAKGFGTPKPANSNSKPKDKTKRSLAGVDADSSNAVQQAVRLVEGDNKARPIDPKEAAKGKVDYVKVADWGPDSSRDPGELRLAADGHVITTHRNGNDGGSNTDMTFYEELARRLEFLKANGALSVAQPAGSSAPPPFERWGFERMRYIQYLMDNMAVHIALEDAIGTCSNTQAAATQGQVADEYLRVQYAVALFDEACGLDRSFQIASDLNALALASSGEPFELEPTQQADAYADYLVNLAERFHEAVEEEGPQLSTAQVQDATNAGLRLLAHVYALHVAHLTTGMRIGAAAVERLDLLPVQATNFYQTYPSSVDDPLKTFRAAMDSVGRQLSREQREILMGELPKAFQKTSLLLTSLAHE